MSTVTTQLISHTIPILKLNIDTERDSYPMPTVSTALPSQDVISRCANVIVKDANGGSHTFRSLYEDPIKRTLFVFVRHFYCGVSL